MQIFLEEDGTEYFEDLVRNQVHLEDIQFFINCVKWGHT